MAIVATANDKGLNGEVIKTGHKETFKRSSRLHRAPPINVRSVVKVQQQQCGNCNEAKLHLGTTISSIAPATAVDIVSNSVITGNSNMAGSTALQVLHTGRYNVTVNYQFFAVGLTSVTVKLLKNGMLWRQFVSTGLDNILVHGLANDNFNSVDELTMELDFSGAVAVDILGSDTNHAGTFILSKEQ